MKKIAYILPFLLAACDGGSFKTANRQFTENFNVGAYAPAAQLMADATVTAQKPNNIYLGGLQCGTGFLWGGVPLEREMCFAATDSVLVGDIEEDSKYEIKDYEKIMFKTYAAMGYMADGAYMAGGAEEYATQMFRQAYELQTENVQQNSEEIEKLEAEFEKKAAKIPGLPDLNTIVQAVDAEMSQIPGSVIAMKDYVNPYTTYINALFDGVNGDVANAENYLSRVEQFAPYNGFVKTDAEAIISKKPQVWVFFENGTVGEIKSRSLAPEILRAYNIKLTIPDVWAGAPAVPILFVGTVDVTTQTEFLANMDSIVKTDLEKYKTRNIVSSVVFEVGKVAAATAAGVGAHAMSKKNKKSSELWEIGGTLAVAAIMSAEKSWDLRSWTSLPNEIQVARVEMPNDRKITINQNYKSYEVVIPDDIKNAAIFVRIPTVNAEPSIVVGKLN